MSKKKQTKETDKPQPQMVRCCDCERCTRDTSGRSFSISTGEFFMGTWTRHAYAQTIYD